MSNEISGEIPGHVILDNFEKFLAGVDEYDFDDLLWMKEVLDARLEEIKIAMLISKKCPKCGSEKVLKIEYGLPGDEMMDRDDIYLGGCCIDEDNKNNEWHCKKCHWEWGKNVEGGYCEDDIEEEEVVELVEK